MAKKINASRTDVVHLQHEFGLFGGADGEYILDFVHALTKPLIVTFHTVLLLPSDSQKMITQSLARLSRKVTVMDEIAKDRLETVYGINQKDISVILHGAPVVAMPQYKAKKTIGMIGTFLVLANNLLSRNKGMEYVIEAVAQCIKEIPSIVFYIVGETHPLVKVAEGEAYRNELTQLVKKYHLQKHVIFKNEYISLAELKILLAATDVYVTPYLDPQQITSGTLTYAIAAQKVCISTEYVYAKEMLAKGRGILVPFRNSQAIAKGFIMLSTQPEKRQEIEKNLRFPKRLEMSWMTIAKKHLSLYTDLLTIAEDVLDRTKAFLRTDVDISYLSNLTDTVGVMQHAYHTIPDRRFGYSTDDNARALIVVAQLARERKDAQLQTFIQTYIGFLQFSQETDGKMHTFLNFDRKWMDVPDITDAYGKAIWAFGFYLSLHKDSHLAQPVQVMFAKGLQQVGNIRDLRAAAYTILGLYYYLSEFESKTELALHAVLYAKQLADLLVKRYEKESNPQWQWFENDLTYDNFRLPQALFAAYLITKDEHYKEIATKTLTFVTTSTFHKEKNHFDFIGQDGWYKQGKIREVFDQQPIEAEGAVNAYLFAQKVLKNKAHQDKALIAFAWFLGKNRNYRSLYDERTKGVHDGLNLRGLNQNEGAESIVCFLIAHNALKQALKKSKH